MSKERADVAVVVAQQRPLAHWASARKRRRGERRWRISFALPPHQSQRLERDQQAAGSLSVQRPPGGQLLGGGGAPHQFVEETDLGGRQDHRRQRIAIDQQLQQGSIERDAPSGQGYSVRRIAHRPQTSTSAVTRRSQSSSARQGKAPMRTPALGRASTSMSRAA